MHTRTHERTRTHYARTHARTQEKPACLCSLSVLCQQQQTFKIKQAVIISFRPARCPCPFCLLRKRVHCGKTMSTVFRLKLHYTLSWSVEPPDRRSSAKPEAKISPGFTGTLQCWPVPGVVPKSDRLPKSDFRPRERAQPVKTEKGSFYVSTVALIGIKQLTNMSELMAMCYFNRICSHVRVCCEIRH